MLPTAVMAFLPDYSDFWLPVLLALPLALLSFLLLRRKPAQKHGIKLPPGPPALPIIGNLHQLIASKEMARPYRCFWKISQTYGPVIRMQLGASLAYVISSPETAKEALKDNDLECCSRLQSAGPRLFSYDFKDVVFSPYSDHWKETRTLLITDLLSMKRVQSYWYAREAEVDRLNSLLANAYPNTINLTEEVFKVGDGIIGTVAFGKHYANLELKEGLISVLRDVMKALDSFQAEDFFPKGGRLIDYMTGVLAKREETFKKLDGYFQSLVEERLHPNRPKPEVEDVVDSLVRLYKTQSGSKLTKDHMKAFLMNLFIGGVDTSALTITWAFAELIRHPEYMKKAQEEIRSIVGPNKKRVEGTEIEKFKYLDLVLKETWRMHPPVPLLVPHACRKPCKIGGYDVVPGTQIIVNTFAIGRDQKLWGDPDVFRPERFENSNIDYKGSSFELLPFGAGRRICPGANMGTTAAKYILSNVLYGFDYELPGGMKFEDFPVEDAGGLTVYNKYDLIVIPKKHKWTD